MLPTHFDRQTTVLTYVQHHDDDDNDVILLQLPESLSVLFYCAN